MKLLVLMMALAVGVGSVMTMPGCAAMNGDAAEVKAQLAACPKAVQDTLTKEARGGQVVAIVKEVENGKLIYSADVTIGDKFFEIDVAEDGKLIGKQEEKK